MTMIILIGAFVVFLVVSIFVGVFIIKRYSNPAAALVDKAYSDYRKDTEIHAINSQEVIKIQKEKEARAEELRRRREAEERILEQKKAEEKERLYRENLARIRKLVETEMTSTQAYVENAGRELNKLKIDAALLNEAISDVARKFDQHAQEAEKQPNEEFYAKAKYVSLLFKNESIQTLYRQYLNEPLEATASAYRTEIKNAIQVYRESAARLQANQSEYAEATKGLSEKAIGKRAETKSLLTGKLQKYKHTLRKAQREVDLLRKEIEKLTKEYGDYANPITDARRIKAMRQLPKITQALEAKKKQLMVAEEKIARNQELIAVAEADLANFETIETEATVRESFDKAGDVRATKDNEVHRSIQHKNNIISIAARYERETIETLKTRIASRRDLVANQIFDANQKLERLKKIKQMDMISEGTAERILRDFQKKSEAAMDSLIAL